MRNCLKLGFGSAILLAITSSVFAQDAEGGEKFETKTEVKSIEAPIQYKTTRDLPVGAKRVLKPGKAGSLKQTFEFIMADGKVVNKKLVSEVRTNPEPRIILRGPDGIPGMPEAARGRFTHVRSLTMRASAYSTGSDENGAGNAGKTASGIRLKRGVVAVDPRVIPLGTVLFIEGYGMAVAGDTGGAIKGDRIDLCYESGREVYRFGRRKVVVHILRAAR